MSIKDLSIDKTNSAWGKRKTKLFGAFIAKSNDESVDQFIGKLRELEDAKDPYADQRMPSEEETFAEVMSGKYGLKFRDERDRELYYMFLSGILLNDPDQRMGGKIIIPNNS
jgi:hypothetical protein